MYWMKVNTTPFDPQSSQEIRNSPFSVYSVRPTGGPSPSKRTPAGLRLPLATTPINWRRAPPADPRKISLPFLSILPFPSTLCCPKEEEAKKKHQEAPSHPRVDPARSVHRDGEGGGEAPPPRPEQENGGVGGAVGRDDQTTTSSIMPR